MIRLHCPPRRLARGHKSSLVPRALRERLPDLKPGPPHAHPVSAVPCVLRHPAPAERPVAGIGNSRGAVPARFGPRQQVSRRGVLYRHHRGENDEQGAGLPVLLGRVAVQELSDGAWVLVADQACQLARYVDHGLREVGGGHPGSVPVAVWLPNTRDSTTLVSIRSPWSPIM